MTIHTDLEITSTFERAIHIIENEHKNVFITGKAGTGKSTLLKYLKDYTKKNVVLLAPTGVAAVNIGGQTIHSFFKFGPSTTLDTVRRFSSGSDANVYKKIEAIIIDEISMVRADLLDCIDRAMRLNGRNSGQPFGGVQLIFFGDLYQLPPVVPQAEHTIFESYYKSPYFFSSHSFQRVHFETIELDKIYRQKDLSFINLLNNIRNNKCSFNDLSTLNKRLDSGFKLTTNSSYICLTPRNMTASTINESMLNALTARSYTFESEIKGSVSKEYYPTLQFLTVKEGSRIMMVNNDINKRWMNGTMGTIVQIEESSISKIQVLLDNGEIHWVKPHTWEISKFILEDEKIQSSVIGKFKQFPMMLAWAMTIHKSQGKTFDKVLLDLQRGAFSSGQVYVALSRCTSIEGIVLSHAVRSNDIWVDPEVVEFMTTEKPLPLGQQTLF